MPTTPYTVVEQNSNFVVVKWAAIPASATIGDWFACPHYSEKTISIDGTFDSSTIVIQGCINQSTEAFVLTDPQGNAISTGASKIEALLENVYYIRPAITTAGTAPAINVWLLCHTVSKK